MKHVILTFSITILSVMAFAQNTDTETVRIDRSEVESIQASGDGELLVSSSIVCEMCKNTIEEGLAYVDGIKSARVDVKDNLIMVKYKPKKITEEEVKTKITELGYVAGDMKPTKEAYDKLHGCCKKDGVCE